MATKAEVDRRAQEDLEASFGSPVDASNRNRPVLMVEPKGARALALQEKARELEETMRQIGVRPATVINIRPQEIRAQGTHASNYPVPACPIGQRYKKIVIPTYDKAVGVNKYGEEEVKPVLPIQIANDIRDQMLKNSYRGVLVFLGDIDPDRKLDPNDKEMRDALAEMRREKEAMIEEFKSLVQKANDEDSNSDSHHKKNITEVHRMAARYLMHERLLKQPPRWLLETRNVEDIQPPCPNCGTEPAQNALQCGKCFTWIRPFEAYKAGKIMLDDPNGVVALRSLTKEQLVELGLYPTVKPAAEYNAEILKRMKQSDKN